MIGIISGEIIGSPYTQHNLPGLGSNFVPFEENHVGFNEVGYGRRRHMEDIVVRPEAGSITAAVLHSYNENGMHATLRYRKNPSCAMAMSLVRGRKAADCHLSPEEMETECDRFVREYSDESLHGTVRTVFRASYLLASGAEHDVAKALGITVPQNRAALDILRGRLRSEAEGSAATVGSEAYGGNAVLEAAAWAVSTSYNFEEAVKRAVTLGGDSASVGAVAGGLAELVYGDSQTEEILSDRVREFLQEGQSDLLDSFLQQRTEILGSPEQERRSLFNPPVAVRLLGHRDMTPVYAVPDGRKDVAAAILRVRPDADIRTPDEFDVIVSRLKDHAPLGIDGKPLNGAFIAADYPEERVVYYTPKDDSIHSSLNVPQANMMALKGFPSDNVRLANRTAFEKFRAKVEEIRRQQELELGYDGHDGHLRFDTAWWVSVERDRIVLMKGSTQYGAFGLDEYGRLRVDPSVIGGTLNSGERLRGAMDNMRVFRDNDTSVDILVTLREKLLDEGITADEAVRAQDPKTPYDKPEGEEKIPTNYELMSGDIRNSIDGGVGTDKFPHEAYILDAIGVRPAGSRDIPDHAGSVRVAADGDVVSLQKEINLTAYKGAVFTFGFSNQTEKDFLARLKEYGITRVVDIRHRPHSQYSPHFNREELSESLANVGIRYSFQGDVLSGNIWAGKGVLFTESSGGYAIRTQENAQSTDLTFAFAADFSTAGEKATEKAAKGKIFQVSIDSSLDDAASAARDVYDGMTELERSSSLSVNIAGNSIGTLVQHGISQEGINRYVTTFLSTLRECGACIKKVLSGGQTGADEAGIIAAMSLNIPAEVHAPKYWAMRSVDNKDIYNEAAFKSRFSRMLTYRECLSADVFRNKVAELASRAVSGERIALVAYGKDMEKCHRFALVGYALQHPDQMGIDMEPVPVQHISLASDLAHKDVTSQQELELKYCRKNKVEYGSPDFHAMMDRIGSAIQSPSEERKFLTARQFKAMETRLNRWKKK